MTDEPRKPIVVVVGSVNVDLVFQGIQSHPVPGQTVSAGKFHASFGGKGGNQATAAAKAGAEVHLIAAVGADEHGRSSIVELTKHGVDTANVIQVDGPTGVAAVLVRADGENAIVVASGANAKLTPDSVSTINDFGDTRVVVLACLEVPIATVLAWAQHAHERGWTFILNPAPAIDVPPCLLRLVDIITPNSTELEPLGAAEHLFALGVGALVLTRGGDGVDVATPTETFHQPPFPVQASDTTGAGDGFNGALAAAIAHGEDLPSAVKFAAAAGAMATTALGARTGYGTRDQILGLIDRNLDEALPSSRQNHGGTT